MAVDHPRQTVGSLHPLTKDSTWSAPVSAGMPVVGTLRHQPFVAAHFRAIFDLDDLTTGQLDLRAQPFWRQLVDQLNRCFAFLGLTEFEERDGRRRCPGQKPAVHQRMPHSHDHLVYGKSRRLSGISLRRRMNSSD